MTQTPERIQSASHDRGSRQGRQQRGRRRGRNAKPEERDAFEQRVIDIARVTRVMAGGKRMSFRACVVVGDKSGKVGVGVKKGADVSMAMNKAVAYAKKNLVGVQLIENTIPHEVREKYGAAKVLIKPAIKGTGIMAGGSMRPVLELAGVQNVIGKILGSRNKINTVMATIEALKQLRPRPTKKE